MPAKIAVSPIVLDEEGIPSPRALLTTPLFSVRSRRLSEAERSPKGRRPSVSVSVRRGPKTHAFPPASPAATTEGGFFAVLASPPSSPRIQIVVQRAHHATHIDIDVFLWLKLEAATLRDFDEPPVRAEPPIPIREAKRAYADPAKFAAPTTRLSNLRAAAVEEVTSLPAVTRRLESMLLGRHATLEMGRVFEDVAAGVLAHTDALIGGSTAEELASISDSRDPLLDVVAVLEDAQHELGLDLGFALDGVERAIAARGKRLSLERSSIAPEQFAVLRGLAVALVGAYTYLTLDHNGGTPSLLGFTLDGGLDASIGVHVLFSLVVGAVSVFGNLAEDLNRPFTANKLESDTVVASLKQLRDGLLPHIRRG
ncbi:DUF4239-containing protein [Aureococcus anophagefferens]|nr:DUF4239-containing protein [Aureococcus anophagefferens]